MAEILIGFKIDAEQASEFQKACSDYGLNKSKFLRACVEKFMEENGEGKEKFLALLGFKKKVSWTK